MSTNTQQLNSKARTDAPSLLFVHESPRVFRVLKGPRRAEHCAFFASGCASWLRSSLLFCCSDDSEGIPGILGVLGPNSL